jgi:5-methylcytosine-specific restriction protein A
VPTAPFNTKCRELGCKNPKTGRSTFCNNHGGGVTDKGKENNKLYQSAFWKKWRIGQLSKNPLCAACLIEGKVVMANTIDHVFPHKQDQNKFRSNLFQSLCIPHHTLKTQEENKGQYLYYSSNGIVTYTDNDYGFQVANETELTQDI